MDAFASVGPARSRNFRQAARKLAASSDLLYTMNTNIVAYQGRFMCQKCNRRYVCSGPVIARVESPLGFFFEEWVHRKTSEPRKR